VRQRRHAGAIEEGGPGALMVGHGWTGGGVGEVASVAALKFSPARLDCMRWARQRLRTSSQTSCLPLLSAHIRALATLVFVVGVRFGVGLQLAGCGGGCEAAYIYSLTGLVGMGGWCSWLGAEVAVKRLRFTRRLSAADLQVGGRL
jgi:hypothetical protein